MSVDALLQSFEQGIPIGPTVVLGAVATVITALLAWWGLHACEVSPRTTPLTWGLVGGVLSAALTIGILHFRCQQIPEVRPDGFWLLARPLYHSILIILLAAATATDLRSYYILDFITFPGMILGVALATASGQLQICHVWVDWNAEIPQLRGPHLPEWLSAYPHLHGLAWSMAGLVVGAVLTWLSRGVARVLLGQEALGFGDVLLMAMIGSFIGWQPAVLVFLLAPLPAVLAGAVLPLVSRKHYLPYGPFLALAAVLVLFNWSRLWMFEISLGIDDAVGARPFALRRLFGDWQGLLILAGMLGGGLILLLGIWRLYLTIPVSRRTEPDNSPAGQGGQTAESPAIRAGDDASRQPSPGP